MDLAAYRAAAAAFSAELGVELYRHFAGLADELAIEPIYERHGALFTRAAVDELRALAAGADDGDGARGLRALTSFAVEGFLGQATKELDAELARREAELTLAVDGERIGYRESSIVQANEPDRARRAALEAARLEALAARLTPLRLEAHERTHALARELGWASYHAMCSELSGIDLVALERQTAAFAAATDATYRERLEPELRAGVGVGWDELARADLPVFFRDRDADARFPAERLVESFTATLAGLGIELGAQANIVLDLERRPGKSPRAFCSPARVPQEIYLVVPPIGGRDDYVALFHEGGHAEHYAWVDPELPWEFRQLGDNSITEAFAFLFDHLLEDPEWLRRHLDVEDDGALARRAQAQRLLLVRRYGAKLAYELELHGGERQLAELPARYAARLGDAVGIAWPRATWLDDVDPGFYVASYLRAWALETHLRALLRERFGVAWFAEPAAGAFLKRIWRDGQRLRADELLAAVSGAELDFGALLGDLDIAA